MKKRNQNKLFITNTKILNGVICKMIWNTLLIVVIILNCWNNKHCVKRDTEYLSVFSPNAAKYGPEKPPYLDTFYAVKIDKYQECFFQNP